MKIKLLFLFLITFCLTACSNDNEFIPTALITNISYEIDTKELNFRVDITDKSNTIEKVTIELESDNTQTIEYIEHKNQYSFSNVESDLEYMIKIKATYQINKTSVENQVIQSLDIKNYLSTNETYFSSRTFAYTGEPFSIYLSNVDEKYTVTYKNNEQKEVGIYQVTALVYLNGQLQETYTAYLVITNEVIITAENQTHDYTGDEINVEYSLSYTVNHTITYNKSSKAPTDVGVYEVLISITDSDITKTIILEILPIEIEIYTTNKIVIFNDEEQPLDILTNINCEYSVTYNSKTQLPVNAGVYHVVITVESTKNYTGIVKHLTLTILSEEDLTEEDEIFISQIVYAAEDDIIIELYNPTKDSIDLSDYSLFIGDLNYNKEIALIGSISANSTYTIATKKYTDISFDYITNYLVASNNETITLYKNKVKDVVVLGISVNYIRNESVGSPNNIFDEDEWEFFENEIRQTVNNHVYLKYAITSYYEIEYNDIIYINLFDVVDFNDYIHVEKDGVEVSISNEFIISNNINSNVLGEYEVEFKFDNYEFTIIFNVSDIKGPEISVNTTNLTFDIDDTIDFESLITCTDESNIKDISVSYNKLVLGANKINYIVEDEHGNTSYFSLYIFII